jgi:hypothetical protein
MELSGYRPHGGRDNAVKSVLIDLIEPVDARQAG